ncbi:hypothetical protein TNIN_265751, partial [Trichonephila inaurata madagascariensis]
MNFRKSAFSVFLMYDLHDRDKVTVNVHITRKG